MPERDQVNRWRCTVVGCNPIMKSMHSMEAHRSAAGHRVAKWPIRSAEGKKRAKHRNRTGYYDKYNVGSKDASVRLGYFRDDPFDRDYGEDDFHGGDFGG